MKQTSQMFDLLSLTLTGDTAATVATHLKHTTTLNTTNNNNVRQG